MSAEAVQRSSVSEWRSIAWRPNVQDVIVASAGQVSAVRWPLQPADLLGVTAQGGHVVIRHPNVVVVDEAAPWSTAQDVRVPGKGTHSRRVTRHISDSFLLCHIPQLQEEKKNWLKTNVMAIFTMEI